MFRYIDIYYNMYLRGSNIFQNVWLSIYRYQYTIWNRNRHLHTLRASQRRGFDFHRGNFLSFIVQFAWTWKDLRIAHVLLWIKTVPKIYRYFEILNPEYRCFDILILRLDVSIILHRNFTFDKIGISIFE